MSNSPASTCVAEVGHRLPAHVFEPDACPRSACAMSQGTERAGLVAIRSRQHLADHIPELGLVIGKIDILAFNRHEAGALVPWLIAHAGEGGRPLEHRPGEAMPDLARRGLVAGGFELSLAGFFAGLHRLGPRWIVVTDGRDGAYVSAPTGILHCPAPPVTVAGTAGAGDAFNATFAASIAEAASAETAAIAAAANAASVLGHIDTQTGLLRRKDLESRVATLRDGLKITHWKN